MPEELSPGSLDRELTTDIVAAYVRRNQIGSDQLASLISTVHQALSGLGKPAAETETERTPAVPIRRSVHPDYVVCLECGWRSRMLRRHLTTGHGLSVDQYRARWKLPREHPITAPSYSERRSSLAKQLGLGRGRRRSRQEAQAVETRATGSTASSISAARKTAIDGDSDLTKPDRFQASCATALARGAGIVYVSRVKRCRVAVAPKACLGLWRCQCRYAASCCALYAPRKSA